MRLLVQLTEPGPGRPELQFTVDGRSVAVPDDGAMLLEVLRDRLGQRGPKDGCGPQGQCGCCTVWVDGRPRVACVTAARRVAGRSVTTLDGLDAEVRARWVDAFVDRGASQCGFCTPGILMRLAALAGDADLPAVHTALLGHLCRCTGWRPVLAAAADVCGFDLADRPGPPGRRDLAAAARRAELEGGSPQRVGPEVVLGAGGFADDTAPADALVAVPDGAGGWVVGETLTEARRQAHKVQGRRSTLPLRHPVALPPGRFDLSLRTTFVEPAYLEPDAAWCRPGGEPAGPLANGGAFGAKRSSPLPAVARALADRHGRPVRVLWAREDVVRHGPKRPPVGAGVDRDGRGTVRVGRTPGSPPLDRWAAACRRAAPGLEVEEVAVAGPPVSADLRAAGWAEGAVLAAAAAHLDRPGGPVTVEGPGGGRATATVGADGVRLAVEAGDPLDEVVLRSYCVGAAHQALGWVRREGVAVDEDGAVVDLTIRSFGILAARDTPPVTVEVEDGPGPPVPVGDAAFAAVAAAAWLAAGLGPDWPLERGGAP